MDSFFLLGAGASIDAGLSDAFTLTEKIHAKLYESFDKTSSTVFGLIVTKILARKVRNGGSPFEKVNVEEVYDGVLRLATETMTS